MDKLQIVKGAHIMKKKIKQSIVVLYHKNKQLLRYSLQTLLQTIPKGIEIIIVANNKNISEINFQFDYPDLKVIRIAQDLLYSEAANLGVQHASGEIITLCDQDIFYESNWYSELFDVLCSNSNIGAVSPKLINPHNNRIIDFGIAYSEQTIAHPTRGLLLDNPLTLGNYLVSSACGAILMTYKKLYQEIGGMDITMPYICCDCDYCIQLKKRNLETWIVGSSIVYHIGSSSNANTKISSYSYLSGDSKAMFFAKDYSYISHDLSIWMNTMFVYYIKKQKVQPYYYLFNLSIVSDSHWYIDSIRKIFSIEYYDVFSIPVHLSISNDTLSLYNNMPMSMLNINEPIIYFVDSFVSLFNNYYWWKIRNYKNDIVVDRNGNIIAAYNIVHQSC